MNKNTKQVKALVSRASRKGDTTIVINRPVRDWHNQDKPVFRPVTYHCASPNKEGVISQNTNRNMRMSVAKNTDSEGRKYSITRHEPISEHRPLVHKNHNYMTYRQLSKFGGETVNSQE